LGAGHDGLLLAVSQNRRATVPAYQV